MSVLVKGMQMPYGCGNCCFCSSPDYDHNGRVHYRCIAPVAGVCESENTTEVLNFWEGGTSDTFPAYCPLVELPEHHGRLIDADEMRNLWAGCSINGSILPLLDARLTIVEAEGEEQ